MWQRALNNGGDSAVSYVITQQNGGASYQAYRASTDFAHDSRSTEGTLIDDDNVTIALASYSLGDVTISFKKAGSLIDTSGTVTPYSAGQTATIRYNTFPYCVIMS